MMHMKKFLLVGLSAMALSSASFAQDDAQTVELSKKLTLAKEYSKIAPVDVEVNNAIEGLILNVPKENRILFKSILERNINTQRVQSASEMALAEIFTLEELKAMVDFYSTEEGKSVRSKMPDYQERLKPVLEQMVRDALQSYQSQVQ